MAVIRIAALALVVLTGCGQENPPPPSAPAREAGPVHEPAAAAAAVPTEPRAVVIEALRLLRAGDREALGALWPDSASVDDFVRRLPRTGRYATEVGAPINGDAGAGSLFVDVRVRVTVDGRTRDYVAALRKINNVEGATADQLRWRIGRITAPPVLGALTRADWDGRLDAGAGCSLRRGDETLIVTVAGDGVARIDGALADLTGVPATLNAQARGGSFGADDAIINVTLAPDLGEGDTDGTVFSKPVRVEAVRGNAATRLEGVWGCGS